MKRFANSRTLSEDRETDFANRFIVSNSAVGHHTGGAAGLSTKREDVPQGAGTRLLAISSWSLE